MCGLDFNALELSMAALTMGIREWVREGEKWPREKLQTRGEATTSPTEAIYDILRHTEEIS